MKFINPPYLLYKFTRRKIIWRIQTDKPVIYLTFDDGPSPEITEWIIEELKVLRDKKLIARPRVRSNKGYANFPIKWSVEGNFKDYGFKENGVMFRAFASYGLGNDVGFWVSGGLTTVGAFAAMAPLRLLPIATLLA